MKFALLLLVLIIHFLTFSQRNLRDSIISTPWVGLHYGGNYSKGNLAERFGYWNHLGFTAGYKTSRNWIWAVDGNFMFTDKILPPQLFQALVDENGIINDAGGDVAIVLVLGRGYNANVAIGKVIPVLSPNENSGIYLHIGAGQHANKYRIETRDHVVPLLEKEYRKGYDRLATGYNFHQFVGYAFLASKGIINFYAGFYAQQAFTRFQRTINFDQPDIPVSKDILRDYQVGFRAGWFIPIYKRRPKDFYFN